MTPGRRFLRKAADIAGLTKCGIALASAFASAAAYLLSGYIGSPGRIAGTAAAVFLLAAGAGALNNWQDRAEDALMERTRKRPLPSGRVNPNTALLTAAALIAAGVALLAILSAEAAAAGIAAVVLYNGIYTPLKLRTAWAVIPGIAAGTIADASRMARGRESGFFPRSLLPDHTLRSLAASPSLDTVVQMEGGLHGTGGLRACRAS